MVSPLFLSSSLVLSKAAKGRQDWFLGAVHGGLEQVGIKERKKKNSRGVGTVKIVGKCLFFLGLAAFCILGVDEGREEGEMMKGGP